MANLLQNYGKSPCFMGKSTISMAMAGHGWHSFFYVYRRVSISGVGSHDKKKKSYLVISGRQVGVKILVDRTEFFRALAEVGAASQLGEHTLW